MAYIELYTKNIDATVMFYKKLNIFNIMADTRLISSLPNENLIIDIRLSKKNYYISFGMYVDENYEINIIDILRMNKINYKFSQNLGGSSLVFCDNNINQIMLRSSCLNSIK